MLFEERSNIIVFSRHIHFILHRGLLHATGIVQYTCIPPCSIRPRRAVCGNFIVIFFSSTPEDNILLLFIYYYLTPGHTHHSTVGKYVCTTIYPEGDPCEIDFTITVSLSRSANYNNLYIGTAQRIYARV